MDCRKARRRTATGFHSSTSQRARERRGGAEHRNAPPAPPPAPPPPAEPLGLLDLTPARFRASALALSCSRACEGRSSCRCQGTSQLMHTQPRATESSHKRDDILAHASGEPPKRLVSPPRLLPPKCPTRSQSVRCARVESKYDARRTADIGLTDGSKGDEGPQPRDRSKGDHGPQQR